MTDITLSLISALLSLTSVLQNIALSQQIASTTSVAGVASSQTISEETIYTLPFQNATTTPEALTVPFYSQFGDISDPKWQKLGCGIASLAMLIELYEPGTVSVDALLNEGIAAGAYLNNAGWIHRGLADLARDHGLHGTTHDLSSLDAESAFAEFEDALNEGPAIASVHYTFDPQNPIPHLVVINSIEGDTVYYNDPAETSGGNSISKEKFVHAWKKRYIEVLPS